MHLWSLDLPTSFEHVAAAADLNTGGSALYVLQALARSYDALMQHWRAVLPPGRILDAPYEALVADVDTWARRLVEHCGLDWDPACLEFHETERGVQTPSRWQVRQPIYRSSLERWRHYEQHLKPLEQALGQEVLKETR